MPGGVGGASVRQIIYLTDHLPDLRKRAERRLSLHHYPETIKSFDNFQCIPPLFSIMYILKLIVFSLLQ